MEEAASMNKDVVFKVVIPLLEVRGSALLCISTPLNKTNFYSELCDIRDDEGEPIFNVKIVNLFCNKCAKKKKNIEACRHVVTRLPPWKDADKHNIVKKIYASVGRDGDYDRESRGVVTDDGTNAFNKDWIDAFATRAPYPDPVTPDRIIITCDPNSGGMGSDTSIVSAYYHRNQMIIVGLESAPTDRHERKALLRNHLRALRTLQRFQDVPILFVPENNLDDAAGALMDEAKRWERVTLFTDTSGKDGLRTQTGSKALYTHKARDYLEPTDCLWFDKDFICTDPKKDPAQRANEVRKLFVEQLREWRKLVFAGNTARAAPTLRYSGKTDEQGRIIAGKKDDLMIAFTMNAYMNDCLRSGNRL